MNSTNAPDNQLPALLAGHGIHSQRTDRMGNDTSVDELIELVKSLAEQVSLNRLPPPEPSVFYGDPMRYPSWKIAFQTLFEHQRIPAGERLHYIKKYIGGQVKDTVESYFCSHLKTPSRKLKFCSRNNMETSLLSPMLSETN